jgi:sugar porter (SP) family MFS transporter
MLGALFGGWPTDRWGRKPTLFVVGLLYIVSALGCGLAWDAYSFIVARFIGGVGIGISTVAAPLYISEIAPPAYRGRLAGLFQFNIVFGIIIAFVSNYFLQGLGEHAWRWMVGIAVVPSVLYTLQCAVIPESPRWLLVQRRDRAAGLRGLRLVEPDAPAERLEQLADELLARSTVSAPHEPFWSWHLRRPIALAFLMAFFNQLSGINAVLYFAPRIFELAGLGKESALLQSVGIGVTNLLFTFVGLWLIDRLGRRTLLFIGSLGYIASLGLTAAAFFTEQMSGVPLCLFAFIAAHAIGQGAVIWVFIAEIFPNRQRANGQTLGSFTHWLFAALLTTFFPSLVTTFAPGWIFLFFCGMMVLQLLWVWLLMPETKGVALEALEQQLLRGHS